MIKRGATALPCNRGVFKVVDLKRVENSPFSVGSYNIKTEEDNKRAGPIIIASSVLLFSNEMILNNNHLDHRLFNLKARIHLHVIKLA